MVAVAETGRASGSSHCATVWLSESRLQGRWLASLGSFGFRD